MNGMLDLQAPARPKCLRSHRVSTLPSLQLALADLVQHARDSGRPGPINLTDFDPKRGVDVTLNDDGEGNLSVAFRRPKA